MNKKTKPNKIKRWRLMQGLTQKELAVKIGFEEVWGQVCISRWETNRTSPSIQSLIKLSKALRVKITDLI